MTGQLAEEGSMEVKVQLLKAVVEESRVKLTEPAGGVGLTGAVSLTVAVQEVGLFTLKEDGLQLTLVVVGSEFMVTGKALLVLLL